MVVDDQTGDRRGVGGPGGRIVRDGLLLRAPERVTKRVDEKGFVRKVSGRSVAVEGRDALRYSRT